MSNTTHYLYSFHIPIFLFITGFLYNNRQYKEDKKLVLKKKFKRLVLPYFIYGLITYTIWLLVGRKFGINSTLDIPPLKPLIGLFYGNGIDNYLVFNISLWYIPTVFTSTLLFCYVIDRIKNKHLQICIVIALFLLGYADSINNFIRLPWGINVSLIATLFIYAGNMLKEKFFDLLYLTEKRVLYIVCGLALVGLGYWIAMNNSGVTFNSHSYGNIFAFITSAFSSIMGYGLLVIFLLDCKVLRYLGKKSLRLFMLHNLAFSFISAVIKFVFRVDFLPFKKSLVGHFTYFVASVLLVLLYSYILDVIIVKSKNRYVRRLFSRL
jgi:fucose 4-O-acetylase-like acetyltransferase